MEDRAVSEREPDSSRRWMIALAGVAVVALLVVGFVVLFDTDADVDPGDVDIELPEADIDVEAPDIDVEAPDVDIDPGDVDVDPAEEGDPEP